MEASTRYILLLFTCVLLAAVSVNLNNFSFAQSSQSQGVISSSCATGEKLMDYYTAQCVNTFFKTNGTISNFGCDSVNGWTVRCAAQITLDNHSDIALTESDDGGQSYGKEQTVSSIMNNNMNVRHPIIAVSTEKAYLAFEGEVSKGKYDAFIMVGANGANTFDAPINLSNTPGEDTALSFLKVDDTGKVLEGFINLGGDNVADPSVGVYCSRC
jgi:hypothetical protein